MKAFLVKIKILDKKTGEAHEEERIFPAEPTEEEMTKFVRDFNSSNLVKESKREALYAYKLEVFID